ncbi:hypothetical protein ABGB16_27525 [Micromonospora sp. B11E3]|uniref:hypothetical protein n=1 Tax=Micromonospora sp. B11E3 TaxID=3153562 RepID=UPI00325C52B1
MSSESLHPPPDGLHRYEHGQRIATRIQGSLLAAMRAGTIPMPCPTRAPVEGALHVVTPVT